MKIRFEVPGEPRGKGRPRFSNRGGYVRTYTPKETADYEKLIRDEYKKQCGDAYFPRGTPLDVRIVAYFGIPKRTSKKKAESMRNKEIRQLKKCDIDNIIKAILDAVNGVAYQDDIQVIDIQARKFYSDNPRVTVSIEEVTQ